MLFKKKNLYFILCINTQGVYEKTLKLCTDNWLESKHYGNSKNFIIGAKIAIQARLIWDNGLSGAMVTLPSFAYAHRTV